MTSIYESLLNTTVSVYTKSSTTNELGESINTWSYLASGVKCRLVPVTAEILPTLPGETQNIQYVAYFLSSQALSVNDRIKYNSKVYTIDNLFLDSEGYTQKALLRAL